MSFSSFSYILAEAPLQVVSYHFALGDFPRSGELVERFTRSRRGRESCAMNL